MKIRVTQKNFSKEAKEVIERDPKTRILASILGITVDDLPDEQPVWIDTKSIVAIYEPVGKMLEYGVILVKVSVGGCKAEDFYLKNDEDFEKLAVAWKLDK